MDGEGNRRLRRDLILSGVMFLVFATFTALLRLVDVRPMGFGGSDIGFAWLNVPMHGLFPESRAAYLITKWIGYLCLGLAGVDTMGFLAGYMFGHSRRMKRRFIIAMVYYAVIFAFYLLFDHVIMINTRPIGPEPSYPSSHTLLAITVLYEQIQLLEYGDIHEKRLIHVIRPLLYALCALMAALRLASGVHWVTDVIGSVLLSLALISVNRAFTRFFAPPYSGF